jgi:hypothetical protein
VVVVVLAVDSLQSLEWLEVVVGGLGHVAGRWWWRG